MKTTEKRTLGLLHGVNLDMLGDRDPEQYGNLKLGELESQVVAEARRYNMSCITFQSNHEGEMVEKIHELRRRVDGLIINPGAWTHYSYAIHDALELVVAPVIEVHLSDIYTRKEEWRHQSVISDVCALTISGKGPGGYKEAIRWLVERLRQQH